MILILFIALWAMLMIYLVGQVRKPTSRIGQLFVRLMNNSHSGVSDWGLSHFNIPERSTILDVGCGGGRTINKLALHAVDGKIYGVDYAKGSVIASRKVNAGLIRTGRVEITEASVTRLPFPENMFDVVTAVETHYYWPDLDKDVQEIIRVLKPGGAFILIAENYEKNEPGNFHQRLMKQLKYKTLTANEHRGLLSSAGYTDIQLFEEPKKGWICTIGSKPK